MYGMTFNGVKKDYVVTLRGKRRPPWAPLERKYVYVPGMPGAHPDGTEVQPRPLDIPILIESKNLTDLQKLKEDLADWLVTDEPKELIFDDEPDRVYYAQVDGEFNVEEIISVGAGVLYFKCPDPFKYGPLQTPPPFTSFISPIVLHNEGSVEAKPNIKIKLKQSTTYLDIISDEDYMRIGRPANVDVTPVKEKETVLHDTMSTMTGWTDGQSTDIDGGVVSGTMVSDGTRFHATSLGTGTTWHGPVKIKSLGQEVENFQVELQPILDNDDLSKIGRIELYLLDINKKAVGKLSIKDMSKGQGGNIVEMRVGDNVVNTFLINEYGTNWNTWHNFNGILQLTKNGNKWAAYVAKFINGQSDQRTARKLVEWIDVDNQFTRKIAHVVVHIGTYGTSTPSQMSIQDLKVYKLNQITATQIPYIGVAGDIFEFDMKTSKILKNGDFFKRKDFGARFFGLEKGDNALVFSPPEVIENAEVKWRVPYR